MKALSAAFWVLQRGEIRCGASLANVLCANSGCQLHTHASPDAKASLRRSRQSLLPYLHKRGLSDNGRYGDSHGKDGDATGPLPPPAMMCSPPVISTKRKYVRKSAEEREMAELEKQRKRVESQEAASARRQLRGKLEQVKASAKAQKDMTAAVRAAERKTGKERMSCKGTVPPADPKEDEAREHRRDEKGSGPAEGQANEASRDTMATTMGQAHPTSQLGQENFVEHPPQLKKGGGWGRGAQHPMGGPLPEHGGNAILPKKMKEYLDQHVVGQDYAKKVLCVAAYNHYLRATLCHMAEAKEKPCLGGEGRGPGRQSDCGLEGDPVDYGGATWGSGGNKTDKGDTDIVVVAKQGLNGGRPVVLQRTRGRAGQYLMTRIPTEDSVDGKLSRQGEPPGPSTGKAASTYPPPLEQCTTLDKSNVLLFGPTGSGKTHLVQTLARYLKVPMAVADCTTMTQAGYVGDDVEVVLHRLVQDANFDLKLASWGVVFLDEIDKISKRASPGSNGRDVGGEGVQQALLKMLEGSVVTVPDKGSMRHSKQFYKLDTSNILFIAGGAFSSLGKIVADRTLCKTMGFGTHSSEPGKDDREKDDIHMGAKAEDFAKYGMIPELIGRFPILAPLHSLGKADLIDILQKPKNAVLSQFRKILKYDQVELVLTPCAKEAIAEIAMERRTGARALRSTLEETLLEAMYEAPHPGIVGIVVDRDVVLGKKSAIMAIGPKLQTRVKRRPVLVRPIMQAPVSMASA